MPELSIIIPTLNEAGALPTLLQQLRLQDDVAVEVVVGDGGSCDGTRECARAAGARWIATAPGRGAQMNAAAAQARGRRLLFLHADSQMPDRRTLRNAIDAISELPDTAGHFPLRFIETETRHPLYFRFLAAKSRLNRYDCINGDQGFLIPRELFQRVGGFDDRLPYLEDLAIARAISEHGRWITLPGEICTSSRRFIREGTAARVQLNAIIKILFFGGYPLEFFTRAADAYRLQAESGRLNLAPMIRLIYQINRRDGLRTTARRWMRVGGYLEDQLYMLSLFFDVAWGNLTGGKKRLFTSFHDRVLRHVLRVLPCRLAAILLIAGWRDGLFVYYSLKERLLSLSWGISWRTD